METLSHRTHLPELTSKGVAAATSQGAATQCLKGRWTCGQGQPRQALGSIWPRAMAMLLAGRWEQGVPRSAGANDPSGWKSQSVRSPDKILPTAGEMFQLDGSHQR